MTETFTETTSRIKHLETNATQTTATLDSLIKRIEKRSQVLSKQDRDISKLGGDMKVYGNAIETIQIA